MKTAEEMKEIVKSVKAQEGERIMQAVNKYLSVIEKFVLTTAQKGKSATTFIFTYEDDEMKEITVSITEVIEKVIIELEKLGYEVCNHSEYNIYKIWIGWAE